MRPNTGMKPQDILVLIKVFLWKDKQWRQVDLALELGLSQGEINFSLNRLKKSGLLDSSKRQVRPRALTEFLVHGLKYVFPAEHGPISRGMPTAQFHPLLARKLTTEGEAKVVWPDPEGQDRGQSLEPLYPSAPLAARKDADLYEWLALVDAIRAGSARAQKLAIERITKKVENAA